MRDVSELVRDLPTETQNLVYEKIATLDATELERFAADLEQALASSPEAQGTAQARAKAREAREAKAPGVGDPAPEFDLASLDGNERVALRALRGRPVGLIFGSYT